MKRAVVVVFIVLSAAGGQTLRWVYHHGDSLLGIARAVVCSPDSGIYTAGTSFDLSFMPRMTIVGLRPDGGRRWTYERPGYVAWPSQPDFVRRPLAYGTDGNLYAAGAVVDTAGGIMGRFDFTVLSLTQQGQERWAYTWAGPNDSGGFAQAVARGTDGTVYAAGWCMAGGGNMILTVAGLTQAGQLRWTYLYSGHGAYYEMATDVVCGADGSIYVAGPVGMDSAPRLTVISLNPSGSVRWVYRHDSLGTTHGYSLAVACGPDGNIYIAGGIEGTGYDRDFAVVSLTPAGTERWVYRYDGPASSDDFAFSLICAEDGTIYASGYSIGVDSTYDIAVVSLNSSGDEQWVYRLRTHSRQSSEYPLAIGADGNVYAAGTNYSDSTEVDLAVVSLSRVGVERWTYRYNSPQNGVDGPMALASNPDGNIYVAGVSESQYAVISLDPATGVGEERSRHHPSRSTPEATLVRGCLSLSETVGGRQSAVGSSLLDALGRKVLELRPGANDVSGLAPGVYFVREHTADRSPGTGRSAAGREPSAVSVRKVMIAW